MRSQASRHNSPAQPGDTAELEHGFVQRFILKPAGRKLLCSASVVDLMQIAPKGRRDNEVTMTKKRIISTAGEHVLQFFDPQTQW